MCVKLCNDVLSIIVGETLPINVLYTIDGVEVATDLIVGYEIRQGSAKILKSESVNTASGTLITIPSAVTSTLLGEYVLRLIIHHNGEISKEDYILKVVS